MGHVSFLFDTGADCSVLMPTDAINMGVDYNALRKPVDSLGIGGTAKTSAENAHLVFVDDDENCIYGYSVPLLICHPQPEAPEVLRLPSVLGRNIIDQWRVIYDKSCSELSAEVLSVDIQVPAKPVPPSP